MRREPDEGRTFARNLVAGALLFSVGCPEVYGAELLTDMPKVSAMSIPEREAMARRIDVIANRVVNAKQYLYEDTLPIHIKASFDPVKEALIMETDARLGPVSGYPEVEDMQSDVQDAIWPLLENIPSFYGLEWRYGGRDMYFWFPGDRVPARHVTRSRHPVER